MLQAVQLITPIMPSIVQIAACMCCSLGSPNVVGSGGDNLSILLRLCATPTAASVSAAATVAPGRGRGIMHMQVAARPTLCTTHVGGRVVIGQLTEY